MWSLSSEHLIFRGLVHRLHNICMVPCAQLHSACVTLIDDMHSAEQGAYLPKFECVLLVRRLHGLHCFLLLEHLPKGEGSRYHLARHSTIEQTQQIESEPQPQGRSRLSLCPQHGGKLLCPAATINRTNHAVLANIRDLTMALRQFSARATYMLRKREGQRTAC